MTDYFGYQTGATQSGDIGGAEGRVYLLRGQCPGSGDMQLVSLEADMINPTQSKFCRMALMTDNDGAGNYYTIAQGNTTFMPGTNRAWVGHTSFIDGAGTPITPIITGGNYYTIALTVEPSGDNHIYYDNGVLFDMVQGFAYYTGGFGTGIFVTASLAYKFNMRAGVIQSTITQKTYSGSMTMKLESSAVTDGPRVHYYLGNIEMDFSAQSQVKSSPYRGIVPIHLGLASPVSHFTGIAPPFIDPANKLDLIIHNDVVDMGLAVNHLGAQGVTDMFGSMFIVDTWDHDGLVARQVEIEAKNLEYTDQYITLKRVVNFGWNPDSLSTEAMIAVPVPARTTEWTVIRGEFTPTPGSYRYFWSVPDSSVFLATGRDITYQNGASRTLLWRPVADANEGSTAGFNGYLDSSWGTPGPWQEVGGTWYWDASAYVANAVSIVLEACCGSTYGGVVTDVCLWDKTTDTIVPDSSFTVLSGGAFRYPASWVERCEFDADNLIDGHLYRMRFRRHNSWGGGVTTDWLSSSLFQRGAFRVRLQGLQQAEVSYRVCKAGGTFVADSRGSSRVRIDLPSGRSKLLRVRNETCSAAVFNFSSTPEVDYWITDDDARTSGDAGSAIAITDSNAHQGSVADLLPIFSNDFQVDLVPGDYFTYRSIPGVAGDSASQWTLINLLFGQQTTDTSGNTIGTWSTESCFFSVTPSTISSTITPCATIVNRIPREIVCLDRQPTMTCLSKTPDQCFEVSRVC